MLHHLNQGWFFHIAVQAIGTQQKYIAYLHRFAKYINLNIPLIANGAGNDIADMRMMGLFASQQTSPNLFLHKRMID